jgi:hypothetical protein
MAHTTVPAAIDYLVAQIAALPECASPVRVFDGYPDTETQTYVIIGGRGQAVTADSSETWASLGRQAKYETYRVFGEIYSADGGTAQKPSRDRVYTILNAISDMLRADYTLGGLVGRGAGPAPAELAQVGLEQTSEETAASGRDALLSFYIDIHTRI